MSAYRSGVALMLVASGCFAGMSAAVKALGPNFPYAEIVMFRSLLALPLLLGLVVRARLSARPRRPALMLLRGLLGLGAMVGYFYALQRGLLANMVLINRFQPVLVALFAPLLIGERMTRATGVALLAGLGGVLLVVRPVSTAAIDLAAAAALGGALFSALAHLTVRRLNATDPPLLIVVYFSAITGLGGLALAFPRLVWPTVTEWLLLVTTAAFATAGQLLMTTAYRHDRAPVVSAASYSSVAYALVLGLLFWREVPDPWALLGGAAIVAGGLVLLASRGNVEEKPR